MGPNMVVPEVIPFGHLFHPLPHDDLRFPQAVEDFSIQKIISKGAVSAFIKAILLRATRLNLSGFHPNPR